MTQRQITQPLPVVHASSSSTGLFLATPMRSRPFLLHIPPAPLAERFPEVLPAVRDVVILAALVLGIVLYWFALTPPGEPPLW